MYWYTQSTSNLIGVDGDQEDMEYKFVKLKVNWLTIPSHGLCRSEALGQLLFISGFGLCVTRLCECVSLVLSVPGIACLY